MSRTSANRPGMPAGCTASTAKGRASRDFLRRAGRTSGAVAAYQIAIQRANTEAERRHLRRRLNEVSNHPT